MPQPQKVLLLVPLGSPTPVLLKELEGPISLQLGLASVVSKASLPAPPTPSTRTGASTTATPSCAGWPG